MSYCFLMPLSWVSVTMLMRGLRFACVSCAQSEVCQVKLLLAQRLSSDECFNADACCSTSGCSADKRRSVVVTGVLRRW
jgi:hypothetical protein